MSLVEAEGTTGGDGGCTGVLEIGRGGEGGVTPGPRNPGAKYR